MLQILGNSYKIYMMERFETTILRIFVGGLISLASVTDCLIASPHALCAKY